MKKSKSKLIVGIIIVLIIAIIVVGGAYLYFATDLFKGNDQLFFKYLAKNSETIKQLSLNNELEISRTKHSTESEITFNIESNDSQIANQSIPAGNFNVKYSSLADPENNNKSSETTLKYLKADLFTLKYIRNNDLYALKSDEVVNKYLALDNNNLKEFAKKLGMQDTSLIPNKLQVINFEDLFSITEEQQKALLQKYLGIINTQISKDKYSSQKDVTITVNDKNINTIAYSLELTQDEVIKLLNSILDTIKNDDIMLNILVDKIKILDNESSVTLNDLKDGIQNIINDLNNIQTINGETLKITVYASDGKLVRTEVAIGNDIIYIDTEKNDTSARVVISFENANELSQSGENDLGDIGNRLYAVNGFVDISLKLKKFEIANQIQDNKNTTIAIITFKTGDETIRVSAESKTEVQDSIKNNTTININMSDNTYITAKINTTKVPKDSIEIEQLTKENSATINNFTPQYINNLSQAIVNRIQSLYKEKLEIVNRQIDLQNAVDNANTLIQNEFNETV